ncbi:MAG: hypothetical protein HZB99_04490 [Candidatus Harrisonbacteria bacterium]|nr:hypothetical protein [Candidatus Harrisonbacteria bacterium]
MSKKIFTIFLLLLLAPLLINPLEVNGDTIQKTAGGTDILTRDANRTYDLPNPLGTGTDITKLFARIGEFLLWLGTAMLTLMIIWGALQILTAAGNEEQISKGRRTITWAIVGYLLLLVAAGINLIIKNVLSGK